MTPEELHEKLRYLETWGMAYMYVTATTFIILLVGIGIWAIKQ